MKDNMRIGEKHSSFVNFRVTEASADWTVYGTFPASPWRSFCLLNLHNKRRLHQLRLANPNSFNARPVRQ
jgi:hypothetical protein